MARPRGMRNAVMLNGRITVEQWEWIQEKAEGLGGNVSAALRQAITDARLLEYARDDYRHLLEERKDFAIPPQDDPPGETRVLEVILSGFLKTDVADLEFRKLETAGEG